MASPARSFTPEIFENECNLSNVNAIAQYYEDNGFVLINLLTHEECRDNVLEQWDKIILKQPWEDGIRLERKKYEEGDDSYFGADDDEAFFKYVTKPNMSKTQLDAYKNGWPMHRGFGACCDPVVFHLPGVWKIREKQLLYEVAVKVLREPKLWVSIDRSIQKLPNEGDKEFLHLDLNLEEAVKQVDAPSMMQGKVCYTNSKFVLVPGSNKQLKDIHEQYERKGMNSSKYSFEKQEDHLHFIENTKTIDVPAGHAIFWSSHLVHGVEKLRRDACIQYGAYIGFMPAICREEYHKKSKDHELSDRISSYQEGDIPKLWPSLDSIHFYPKSWNCWKNVLQTYIDKLAPTKGFMIEKRLLKKGKNGETMDIIVPEKQADYHPTPLNTLGYLLLGLERWPRIHLSALDDQQLTWPQVENFPRKRHKAGQSIRGDCCYSSNHEITGSLHENVYFLRL
jgi:hypothetical protein